MYVCTYVCMYVCVIYYIIGYFYGTSINFGFIPRKVRLKVVFVTCWNLIFLKTGIVLQIFPCACLHVPCSDKSGQFVFHNTVFCSTYHYVRNTFIRYSCILV